MVRFQKKIFKLPIVAAFAVFLFVLTATQYLTYQQFQLAKENEQEVLLHELNRVNDKFRNIISCNLIAANTLAIISKEYGSPENFDSIAQYVLQNNKFVDALQLTQKGVITHLYPLKGNINVIGHNTLKDSLEWWETKTAIDKQEIFFTGPRKLLIGDYGITGKIPIIVNNKLEGFSISVAKLPTIKKAIEPTDGTKDLFTYSLLKNYNSNRQTIFNLSSLKTHNKSEVVSIDIPRGNWKLQIAYSEKYVFATFSYVFSAIGFLISIFSALLVYQKMREQKVLKSNVQDKTHLLNKRIKELSTIYTIDSILVDESLTIDQKLAQVVNLIPQGFQTPDNCGVKMSFDNRFFCTENFKESDLCLTSVIELQDGTSGILKVVYLEKTSCQDETFFIQEEIDFVNSIAKNITVYINKDIQKEALELSEKQFKISFDKAVIGKAIVSTSKRFLKVNEAFCEMLGYRKDELLQLDFEKITHPDDLEKDKKAFVEILDGKKDTYTVQKRYVHKNGSVVWANVNAVLVRNKNHSSLFFVVQIENITEKVESETKFKDLVEESQVGVYIIQRDRFIYVNPNIISEFGYSEEELCSLPISHFIHENDLSKVLQNVDDRTLGKGGKSKYEARIKTKEGEVKWVEVLSSSTTYKGEIAIIGTLVNKTNEKLAHIELLKSEANLKSIFDSTEVAYLLMDTHFNIISYNRNLSEYHFELCGAEVNSDLRVLEQMDHENREKHIFILNEVLQNGETIEFEQKEYRPKQNLYKYYQFTVSPVKNKDEVIGICVAIINITAKKNLELERQQMIEDLILKNRDLEQFSYIVSHNMRVPIANLLGLVQMLNGGITPEDQEFIREAFQKSAIDLDKVVTDVNDVLNLRKNKLQTKRLVDWAGVMNKVQLEMSEVIRQTDAKIEYDFSNCPDIYSVAPYLENVFHNLISNSLKFSSENVRPEINIWAEVEDDKILLHFKDNGTGIDLDRYGDKIFGLYKRFDLSKEGQGMGLFVVKAQVNALNGTISVKSKPGEGSTFTIALPAIEILEKV